MKSSNVVDQKANDIAAAIWIPGHTPDVKDGEVTCASDAALPGNKVAEQATTS